MRFSPVLPAVLLAIALVLSAGCTQAPAAGQNAPVTGTVALAVPFPPVPVGSMNGTNLAYELELRVPEGVTAVPQSVEVVDPATGKTLFAAEGDVLAALFHPASVPPPAESERENGTAKLTVPRISLWLVLPPGPVPDRLSHRVVLDVTPAAGAPSAVVATGEVAVRKDLVPVVVGAPVRGPGWVATETTSPSTHHFRAQVTVNGTTRVPQRYAQDWIYVDPATGRIAGDNATDARDYLGFGREILAVGNGTVADALDGLPDIPGVFSAPPATVATMSGNYVILDLGGGKYACYAHLANGSVRVERGDAVAEGQVIGLMGNSGNSDIPHLHFQVVTGSPSFLGSEGYPHVYRSFDVIGTVNMSMLEERLSEPGYSAARAMEEFGSFVAFLGEPVPQENRLPENNVVVRFP
ncbi:MAG: M23 family metallopeptidase [Methanolinea sp.]|nr:M23 family metallopeptidase [Methanolinea sp.]